MHRQEAADLVAHTHGLSPAFYFSPVCQSHLQPVSLLCPQTFSWHVYLTEQPQTKATCYKTIFKNVKG